MNIMKAYDKRVAHTLSLKLTRKTENEEKTGFRWDMITDEEFKDQSVDGILLRVLHFINV